MTAKCRDLKRYGRWLSRRRECGSSGGSRRIRYYNMDQVVGQALATFRRIDEMLGKRQARRPAANPNLELAV